jgi:nitric oxide dioxygenase
VAFYEFPTAEDVPDRDYHQSGRISIDWLKATVPVADADFYLCGLRGLMRMFAIGLRALDVPDDRLHFEFFGPAETLYA